MPKPLFFMVLGAHGRWWFQSFFYFHHYLGIWSNLTNTFQLDYGIMFLVVNLARCTQDLLFVSLNSVGKTQIMSDWLLRDIEVSGLCHGEISHSRNQILGVPTIESSHCTKPISRHLFSAFDTTFDWTLRIRLYVQIERDYRDPYIPNSLKGMGLVGALNPRNFRFQVLKILRGVRHDRHVPMSQEFTPETSPMLNPMVQRSKVSGIPKFSPPFPKDPGMS